MKTDRAGLSFSQISRINRLKMTRYQERKRKSEAWIIVILFCLWFGLCLALSVPIHKELASSPKLTTALPSNLDEQTPSITIYAEGNR